MRIQFRLFPNGRKRALTFSYDDGTAHDRRLVEIFDRYGVRATFHLNSGKLDRAGWIRSAEVASLYKKHEVSVHTIHHYHLERIPPDMAASEILDDRRALEALVGYPVRGMSFPFGAFNDDLVRLLPSLGIEYARTVRETHLLEVPGNFYRWDATCHHNHDLLPLGERFLKEDSLQPVLMVVWGHSWDFDQDDNWSLMEEFCRLTGGKDDIWYATCMEITEYITAVRRLRFSVVKDRVYNPSSLPVWIEVDSREVMVPPGQTLPL
jgi:peptidoglycan/xylan/chitin deacetylase (PgdA/CDA1 family)